MFKNVLLLGKRCTDAVLVLRLQVGLPGDQSSVEDCYVMRVLKRCLGSHPPHTPRPCRRQQERVFYIWKRDDGAAIIREDAAEGWWLVTPPIHAFAIRPMGVAVSNSSSAAVPAATTVSSSLQVPAASAASLSSSVSAAASGSVDVAAVSSSSSAVTAGGCHHQRQLVSPYC